MKRFSLSVIAWIAVGVFWLQLTRSFHPTHRLAVIVTTSLVTAFAVAAYINHLLLIPRLWRRRRFLEYAAALVATMALLTALALAVIRTSYITTLGPDLDPYGLYKHFAVDFTAMALHVAAAAAVVWAFNRLVRTH